MPHLYSNTLPDPFLPLIDKEAPAHFILNSGDKGVVYPQRKNKDDATHHTRLFYVEFPEGSSRFHETDAWYIARFAGGRLPHGGLTPARFAEILAEIPAGNRLFQRILSAFKPQH